MSVTTSTDEKYPSQARSRELDEIKMMWHIHTAQIFMWVITIAGFCALIIFLIYLLKLLIRFLF